MMERQHVGLDNREAKILCDWKIGHERILTYSGYENKQKN